jgi:hypothetical protein
MHNTTPVANLLPFSHTNARVRTHLFDDYGFFPTNPAASTNVTAPATLFSLFTGTHPPAVAMNSTTATTTADPPFLGASGHAILPTGCTILWRQPWEENYATPASVEAVSSASWRSPRKETG